MSEKDTVQQGLICDANNDEELQNEMFRTRCFSQKWNNLPYKQEEEHEKILYRLIDIKEGVASDPLLL